MRNIIHYTLIVLMIVAGVIAAYTLLTAGSPDSYNRLFFKNPAYDLYIAVATSLFVFIGGFFVFQARNDQAFKMFVEQNAAKIRELRKKGWADDDIAVEMLKAVGSTKGVSHSFARKRLVYYLSIFK